MITYHFVPSAMNCKSPLTYHVCGSFCPPTCANKDPDCGKDEGKCNEGCFCPLNTYLQDNKCVTAEDCKCEFDGEFKEVSYGYKIAVFLAHMLWQ